MSAEEKAKKLLDDHAREEAERVKLQGENPIVKTVKNYYGLARFWYQFTASMTVIYRRFIYPIYSWGYWLFSVLFWKRFRYVWDRTVYTKNAAGDRKFSKVRGASVIATTAALLYVGFYALFVLFDATVYMFTARVNESVYLSNAEEIAPDSNVFSVRGCVAPATGESFSCGAEDSLYFRISPSNFNHVWSFLNTETMLFYPEEVAAPIAPGWQQCTITSYGIRVKFLMRNWDIYPELVSARCTAIPGQ
jgi:hypothetical protein